MENITEMAREALALVEDESNVYSTTGDNEGWFSVFGGQLMAQALVAAESTVQAEQCVSTFHTNFFRPGDLSKKIDYKVENVRDGNRTANRRVTATQENTSLCETSVAFYSGGKGLDHQKAMPRVSAPENCPGFLETEAMYREHYPGHLPDKSQMKKFKRPGRDLHLIDMRFVNTEEVLRANDELVDHLVWIKSNGTLASDFTHHNALLAYASDQGLTHSVAQPHSLGGFNPRLQFLSLDHTMSFYRSFRMDEWILFVQSSPTACAGRCSISGLFYTSIGELVATFRQDALMRLR